jgi:YHS domain-containing protein
MTAARQQRKSRQAFAAALGLALLGSILAPSGARAATDDRTVVNVNSGLAISGFDPVAYFTDGKPTFGRADLELSRGGVVWRFCNEGNRAAFSEHSDVYMPRFGGYDPVAVARGASVPGHPTFWAVVGGGLYLFYSDKARAAFIADPGRIIETAERKWPKVARTIGR